MEESCLMNTWHWGASPLDKLHYPIVVEFVVVYRPLFISSFLRSASAEDGLYDNFEYTVSVKNLPDKIDEHFSDEILSDQVSVMCSNWDTLDNIRNKTWILRLED